MLAEQRNCAAACSPKAWTVRGAPSRLAAQRHRSIDIVQLPSGAWLGWLAKAPSLQPSADLRVEFYAAPFEAAIRGKARCPEPLIGEITKREAVILHVRLLWGSVLFRRRLDGFAAAGQLSLPTGKLCRTAASAASRSW